jgi:hypothetical protein
VAKRRYKPRQGGSSSEDEEIAAFNRYVARLKAQMLRPFEEEFGRDQFAERDRIEAMSDVELRELAERFVDDPWPRDEEARGVIGALDMAAELEG